MLGPKPSNMRIVSAPNRRRSRITDTLAPPERVSDTAIEMREVRKLESKNSKIDLNKGDDLPPEDKTSSSNSIEKGRTFGEVAKTVMLVTNWVMSNQNRDRNNDEHASEIFEPAPPAAETTNIVMDVEDNIFEDRPSGIEVARAFIKRLWMKTIYFNIKPTSSFFYYWTLLVSLGVLYNMLGMVIFIFDDVYNQFYYPWFYFNCFFDIVYILDMLLMTRKVFVHDGSEVRNHKMTFKNYLQEPAPFIGVITVNKSDFGGRFLLDIVSILPFDFFLWINSSLSIIRSAKIFKAHRIMDFMEKTQKRTRFPHAMKIFFLMSACFILFHWNACVYFLFSLAEGLSEEDTGAFGFSYYKVFDPRFPMCDPFKVGCLMDEESDNVLDLDEERPKYQDRMYDFWKSKLLVYNMGNFSREYTMSMYWSALTITTCGQQPYPSSSPQNMLEVVDTLIGVLVFATIIGSVGSVVTEMNQRVYDFRKKMDGIKFYMKYRVVDTNIQDRVLSCFMYMNSQHQLTDEAEVLDCLPPRIVGQLAVNLHMEQIKKVRLFKDCEPGFLYEIVLNIKQQVFSPNDYLCRTGDKAKEMYIVKRGLLNVIDDSKKEIDEIIQDGATFGEMCIVHVKGSRLSDTRTHSLRSVGFSDIYILQQDAVSALLSEYPKQRDVIIKNASEWLASRGLLDESEEYEGRDDDTVYSLEEQLRRLRAEINGIDSQLNNMYTSFNELSTDMKRRVTALEVTFKQHKGHIKKDLMRKITQDL